MIRRLTIEWLTAPTDLSSRDGVPDWSKRFGARAGLQENTRDPDAQVGIDEDQLTASDESAVGGQFDGRGL